MKWDAFEQISAPRAWRENARALAEQPLPQKQKRPVPARFAGIAACLCVAAVGTAAAAALIWGTPVLITLPDETHYLVQTDVTHLSPEEYTPALCDALAGARLTHASRTAKPFFEKRGWRVVKEQQVERHGVLLTNFVMER